MSEATDRTPSGTDPSSGPTVVLTMIVKNEAHVIERCLASALPVIDAWCIVDTGSTDGTQDVIRAFMGDLPGAVYDIPWRDFAYNRTKALELAANHGTFALTIDADNICTPPPGFDRERFKANLTADYYSVSIDHGTIDVTRPLLTRTALPFRYEGVLHEYLEPPQGAVNGGLTTDIAVRAHFDGARSSNPRKFLDDADVLRAALRDASDDLRPRYQFYLAQSLRDAGATEEAFEEYRVRAELHAGYDQERSNSWMWCGHLALRLGRPVHEAIDYYLRAFDIVSTRAEYLCHAAKAAREAGRTATAYLFASQGKRIERPAMALFLEPDVYEWRLDYELSIAAYYAGTTDEGRAACLRVLACPSVPDPEREATEKNLRFYEP